MYLKQLNIHGFKSFSDKVKLEFNKGITAVVGPNGSGKSNVSDAVRWVLGEQKAKTLRGDKMEDIIFVGTETRKPLGFAEVSITIDNADQKMPIAYTEVTVTRRVYRSGESEYQINNTNCRLKDIHELFMDTGVGREGYSIIGQGRIDELLNARADERRRIFEEAAGIVKYKVRKNEAILKLEKEQQNLVRVEDIIAELEGQLGSLEKQSHKAKVYLALKEKIKYASLSIFCTDIDDMEKEYQQQQKNKDIAVENKKDISYQNRVKDKQKEQIQKQADALKEQLQQQQQKILSLRSWQEKTESDIRLGKEQIQHLLQNIERLQKEKNTKENKKEENKKEIQMYQTKITAMDVTTKATKERLQQQETLFEQLSKNLYENEKSMEEYKGEMVEQIRISTQTKADMTQRQSMLEQFGQRQQQVLSERDYLQDQLHGQKIHMQVIEKQQKAWQKQQQEIEQELKELEQSRKKLLLEKEAAAREQKNTEQQLSQKRSRLAVLSDMEKEHEGFFKSVKSILSLPSSKDEKWQGICGAVGELLHVPQQYEAAIETALGNTLQNIVTKTEEDAKEAIQYLKSNHLGRATFLPITAVKGKKMAKEAILQEQGVIGIASDLVEYDHVYENIIHSLLGRTIVMEHLEFAVAAAKKYAHKYRIVTLEGDLLSPGGAMTGGSSAKKASSIFGRSREIRNLAQSIQSEQTLLQSCQKKLETLEEALEQTNQMTMKKHIQNQQIQLSLEKNQEDKQTTKNSIAEKTQKQKLYELEEKQLLEQCQEAEREWKQFQRVLKEAEQKMAEINQKLSSFQDSMTEEKKQRDTLLNAITELKVSISSEEQNKISVQQSIHRLEAEIKQLKTEQKHIDEEKEAFLAEKTKKEKEMVLWKENIVSYQKQQQQQQSSFEELTAKREEKKAEMALLEQQQKQTMEVIARLDNEIFRIETKMEKIAEQKQRLFDEIWEEYEMTYQMAKEQNKIQPQAAYSKLKTDIKEWKNEIKELGAVHVGAIEAYEEVKQRYGFLTEQRSDILQAEEKLQILIGELSQMMEERFREQFQVISNNFGEVFREMFGGGKAYLKLNDETNVLESSIEIIAQPPGKSLQNMLLLSGGERALTAIAILFSILKMKPSPFCILDEIEAALDDANVKRFADYLKKFSEDTQFIVITHRKGTMEAADVMYGVTMQEKGISKLISVNFEEKVYA